MENLMEVIGFSKCRFNTIDDLIRWMHQYQKKQGIKNKCLSNSMFVTEVAKAYIGGDIKLVRGWLVKATLHHYDILPHAWVTMYDIIVEPSEEWQHARENGYRYCNTVQEMKITMLQSMNRNFFYDNRTQKDIKKAVYWGIQWQYDTYSENRKDDKLIQYYESQCFMFEI